MLKSNNKDTPDKIEKYRDHINQYFEQNNNYGKYSFKKIFQKQMNYIVEQFFQILVYYFDKYSEKQFHERMNNRYYIKDGNTGRIIQCVGFDYIGDWKKFHKHKFAFFIKSVQINKSYYVFSEEKILETILKLFHTKGWTVSDNEMLGIRQTVKRLYNILYLKYDGLD